MRFVRLARAESGQESEYGQEPTIEVGKDSYRFWWRVLAVVIVAAIVIGYVASISYVAYPYNVQVKGTFTAADGSRALLVDFFECSDMDYSVCPDPGQQPVDTCIAPQIMNMTGYCTEVYMEAHPGQYQATLKNGEDYTMKGYMVNSKGTFDKVCTVTIVLYPLGTSHTSIQNFSC